MHFRVFSEIGYRIEDIFGLLKVQIFIWGA